jgi:hypothetical protein
MQDAIALANRMHRLVVLYEAGTIGDPDVFETELTAQQIIDLKQSFAAARTQCIAALTAITG